MGNSPSSNIKQKIYHGSRYRQENTILDIPWRMFEGTGSWTKEYRQELIQDICSTVPRDGVSNFKFLLLGHIYSGKSTFVNAVASIDAGEITQVVNFGGEGHMRGSLTQRHTFYKADQTLKNFILCDTIGFEYGADIKYRNKNLKLSEIGPLLEGHIKPYSENWEISRQMVEEPSISDKIHCVALVIDSQRIDLDNIPDSEQKYLKELTNQIRQYGCPLVVILNKIDKICGEVNRNISMTFSSRNVKECVEKASDMFGIPKMNIYPVQNYTEQMGLDCKMDILILMAIKHMIKLANGYIKILRSNTEDGEHRNNTEVAVHRNSSEDAEHRNSSEDAEHRNSSEDFEHRNSSEDAKLRNSSEDAEHKNSSEDAELRNSSEEAEFRNSSEDAELRNSSEDAENRNSSDDLEVRNSSEDAEHRNSSEDAEYMNSSEEAEHRNSSEDAEQIHV